MQLRIVSLDGIECVERFQFGFQAVIMLVSLLNRCAKSLCGYMRKRLDMILGETPLSKRSTNGKKTTELELPIKKE